LAAPIILFENLSDRNGIVSGNTRLKRDTHAGAAHLCPSAGSPTAGTGEVYEHLVGWSWFLLYMAAKVVTVLTK